MRAFGWKTTFFRSFRINPFIRSHRSDLVFLVISPVQMRVLLWLQMNEFPVSLAAAIGKTLISSQSGGRRRDRPSSGVRMPPLAGYAHVAPLAEAHVVPLPAARTPPFAGCTHATPGRVCARRPIGGSVWSALPPGAQRHPPLPKAYMPPPCRARTRARTFQIHSDAVVIPRGGSRNW